MNENRFDTKTIEEAKTFGELKEGIEKSLVEALDIEERTGERFLSPEERALALKLK